ncbi:MAG: YIP1 family protein [Bacteroidales bacterium]|nr:YIP1 family protein [Bacteroidales bacterium]
MEKIYKETFIGLFTKPKETFKTIIDLKLNKYQVSLLMLAGISNALSRAVDKHTGDIFGLTGTIIICIIAGALFGWIGFYFLSWLISFTGEWINGKAKTGDILNIVSYSLTPTILSILIYVIYILTFEESIFQKDFDLSAYDTISYLIFIIGFVINLGLTVFYLFLLVIGISVLQVFSIGKSLLNLLYAALTVIVPIILIALFFGLLK